jgi:predicted anti-sigma-YlaC factor YlaD
MISCDDYQTKIVAVLDGETSEEAEKLLFAHLSECAECRAFYAEAIRTRRLFSIAMAMKPTVKIGRQFTRTVETDVQRGRNRLGPTSSRGQTGFKVRSRHFLMAGGLVAAILVVVSWLTCYAMSKEVMELRGRLQGTRQDLAAARVQGQAAEDREKEQKAITALYLRMSELEQRVEQVSQLRSTFMPAVRYGSPDRQDDL